MKRINAILPVQRVGWVEQSDTHQLHLMQTMGLAGSTYLRAPLVPRMLRSAISKRRMGGAKRYPSIASYEDDGFRRLNPSYVLNLHWSFAALFMRKTDGVDNETGSSDLPVGRFVDGGVKLFFGFSEKYFCSHAPQITSRTLASHPTGGAYHDRHGRGVECGGRGSVLRATGLQGELKDL
ncbi:MAG TPA: hypothetical protein VK620_36045 [Bradyrhizobium sp.]|nr:hypothetical protein [Bradyrhizobium sp.]